MQYIHLNISMITMVCFMTIYVFTYKLFKYNLYPKK